jgi:hypothetical protein
MVYCCRFRQLFIFDRVVIILNVKRYYYIVKINLIY